MCGCGDAVGGFGAYKIILRTVSNRILASGEEEGTNLVRKIDYGFVATEVI